MKKKYFNKSYTFVGLVVVAVSVFVMSILAKNIEDARILGVHTLPTPVPTAKPTASPTAKPTAATPTPFFGCMINGTAVSSPSLCCSRYAVYVWSSYICGELKPTSTPIPKPTIFLTPGPSGVPNIDFRPRVTPTIKVVNCSAGTLDIACVDSNGFSCKWYRDQNCSWTCNQNCVAPKRCQAGNLGRNCTNNVGQICQEYQNSDCTIDCTQNCKVKTSSSTKDNDSVVAKTFNAVVSVVSKGSCKVGVDYNSDGVVNSMDFAFCNNKKTGIAKSFDAIVVAVNRGVPLWFEWVVSKMIGN